MTCRPRRNVISRKTTPTIQPMRRWTESTRGGMPTCTWRRSTTRLLGITARDLRVTARILEAEHAL